MGGGYMDEGEEQEQKDPDFDYTASQYRLWGVSATQLGFGAAEVSV